MTIRKLSTEKDRPLRSMVFARKPATRLEHASINYEVTKALASWATNARGFEQGVLIGGLAMGFYTRPRETQDVDVLFLSEVAVPKTVEGFKRIRKDAFEERVTQVEVEVVTPNSFNPPLPHKLAEKVLETSVVHQGLRVASAKGMMALKLFGAGDKKRYFEDMKDVAALLMEHGGDLDVDESWGLRPEDLARLAVAKQQVE